MNAETRLLIEYYTELDEPEKSRFRIVFRRSARKAWSLLSGLSSGDEGYSAEEAADCAAAVLFSQSVDRINWDQVRAADPDELDQHNEKEPETLTEAHEENEAF
jgi:hypothetical protein